MSRYWRWKRCPLCKGTGKVVTDRAIGQAMQTLRKKASISLRQLSPRIGYSASYISHLETGRRHWTNQLRDRYLEGLKP